MTKALLFLFLFPSVSFAAFDAWLAQELKAKNAHILKTHTRICAFVPGGCSAWVDRVTGIYVVGRDGNAIYRLTSSGDSRLRPWVYPGGSWSYGGGSWSVTSSGFGISYNGRLCMRNWGPFGIWAAKMTWTGPAPARAAMCNFSPTTAWPAEWAPSWFDTHACNGEYDFLGRYEVRFGGDDTRHFTVLTCNQSFELGAFPEYRADELSCPRPAAEFHNQSIMDELRAGYSALAASSVAHERDYASAIRTDVDKAVEYLTEGVVSTGSVATGNYFPNPFSSAAPAAPMYTLESADGGGQTWLTGTALPHNLAVTVKNSDGSPASGHPVTFSVTAAPASDWSFLPGEPGQSVTLNTVNGTAETGFKLGTAAGDYLIKASCPNCCPNVAFTASALTSAQATELSVVQCDKYAGINSRVNNAFIVRAFNTLTRKGEPGLDIAFSASAAPPGASGQQAMPGSVQTNDLGIAFVSVWTGDKTGSYTYTADCPSCQKKATTECAVSAGLLPSMAAEPEDVGPVAGNPDVTPMLRISNIGYPNDGVSFTTLFGENKVDLAADLKPDTPEYHALSEDIAWEVVDSPADAMDSGNPAPPANGAATYFYVNHPHVPPAPTGRQFPLKYKIQARVTTSEGLVIESYPRHIRQDDIDKCRQEYFDVSETGKDLRLEPYFGKYTRPHFSPGTDGEFVKFSDCYAHIYPQSRAQEVVSLRLRFQGEFGITVTSGYRSARHNKREGGVWNSVHQFGEAVDVQPSPLNGRNIRELWLATDCPKILERMTYIGGKKRFEQMLYGKCDGTGLRDWNGVLIGGVFTSNFDIREKGRKDSNDNEIYDVLEDLNGNNIADIFDESRVIHLGD
jgi:hypothetical protein